MSKLPANIILVLLLLLNSVRSGYALRPLSTSNSDGYARSSFGALPISDEAKDTMLEIQKFIQKGRFIRFIRTLLGGYDVAWPDHYYAVVKRIKDKSDLVRDEIVFLMLFRPEWFLYAKGVIIIGGKTYYIKSEHAQAGFVDFDDLIVVKDIETGEKINKKLIDFIAQHGIKTEFRFEPGMVMVTKGKRNRYDILEVCNGHTNTIDENGKIVTRATGHLDLSKPEKNLRPAVEVVKDLLKGRKLIFETHLHLDEERPQISGDDIKNTTIDGRLASHIAMNEKGKARIFVPRQADAEFAKAIPLVVGIAGTNFEGIEKILRDYYLIQEVDFSFLLDERSWKNLTWKKISRLFFKSAPPGNILPPQKLRIINAINAAA